MGQPQVNLLSALREAVQNGYTSDFSLNEKGDFHCPTREIYNPKVVKMILCLPCRATLYLLEAHGVHGTWIDHWDM